MALRITYRQVKMYLDRLHESQLDCDLTVQIDDEFLTADFRIMAETDVLESNHPVIYIPPGDSERASNKVVLEHIKGIQETGGFGQVGE